MRKFQINLLGHLKFIDPAGNEITVPGRKQQAMLGYLASQGDQPVTRDLLMGLFWGDRFPDQARQSLRQSISKLRKLLTFRDVSALLSDNETISLDLTKVDIDWSQFAKLISQSDPKSDALALSLFKGPLLDGQRGGSAEFEDWLLMERSRFNDIAFPVIERHAAFLLKSGQRERAGEMAGRLIALDPLREGSHRLLMRILAQSGQRAAAIKQFNLLSEMLRNDLDVDPDSETCQLLEDIKAPGTSGAKISINKTSQPDPSDASTKVAVTVLPFQSVGTDGEMPLFANGLAEDILTGLTKYRWLDVIAHQAGEADISGIADIREAAERRDVAYSIEGSVRQLGQRLRITAQLVDLTTGKYAWVQRYDRQSKNLFNLQDELAETIAASVESELVSFEGQKARALSKDNMGAWDCYHLGLATQYEFSTEGNARAQSLFRRAIDLDPEFGMAYARLSYAMVLSAIYFEADPHTGLLDEALELARKATRIDDQDAVARFALGRAHLARGEYERSVFELKRAIELNPSLAQAHCGLGDSLAYMGKAEDAIPCFEEAVRLSPHDPHRWAFSMYGAVASIFAADFEKAVDWAQKSVHIPNSHYWANAALVSALGHMGDNNAADKAVKELLNRKSDFTCAFARERLFFLNDQNQIDIYVAGLEKAGVP